MAEFTAMRNNALPYPVYGAPFTIVFPLLDADGDPIAPSSPDSEISKNGDTAADCTNEAVEISGQTGVCYLSLTATELTTDVASIETASTGAKTTINVLYPRKLATLRSGTAAGGAAGSITLDGSASAIDDYYNGCLCVATIDTLVEARIITDYVGSTKVASVTPNWNVTPDSDDTFIVYLPDGGQQIYQSDVINIGANVVNASALAADAVDEIIDEVIMGSTTLRQMLRGMAAAILGKASGLGTTTAIYRNIADTMPVITATVDADGNRSVVTLDLDDTP